MKAVDFKEFTMQALNTIDLIKSNSVHLISFIEAQKSARESAQQVVIICKDDEETTMRRYIRALDEIISYAESVKEDAQ